MMKERIYENGIHYVPEVKLPEETRPRGNEKGL